MSNDFPGHFCIHFVGSTTHRTKNVDPSHQYMILKAAGKLEEYRNQMDPYELVDFLITAINQQDPYMVEMCLSQSANMTTISERLNQISMVSKQTSFPSHPSFTVGVELPVELEMYQQGKGIHEKICTLRLKNDVLTNRWDIYSEDVLKLT